MPPLLSICIPTWNRASILEEQLKAYRRILEHIPNDLVEFCISDNASTDNTPEIINAFAASATNTRTFRTHENVGPGPNVWNAANLATGKFTFITGDDDKPEKPRLLAAINRLSRSDLDLILINNAPWKPSAVALQDQRISGIEDYLKTLGVFHGSFLGNSIYKTTAIQSTPLDERSEQSCYPHMSPVFLLLRTGSCEFWNLRFLEIDDSDRGWKPRQPLLTSVDMTRQVTDNAFSKADFPISTRIITYYQLIRSLPRAISRSIDGTIDVNTDNYYQDIRYSNLREIYRCAPLFGEIACGISLSVFMLFQINRRRKSVLSNCEPNA